MLDGSVRAIVDPMWQLDKQRGRQSSNDRPMWRWWEHFGRGKGL